MTEGYFIGDFGRWRVPKHIAVRFENVPRRRDGLPDRRYLIARELIEYENWLAGVDMGNWRWDQGLNGD